MWCVLKCRPGKSDEIMEACRRKISPDILRDIFTFTCERMKRYQGSWHVEIRPMFPDYIFLETDCIEELSRQLEPFRQFTEILEDSSMLRRVSTEEELILRKLCGRVHHLGMSQGYIRDGITHVVNGPLVGMERRIRKIDRHKRIAHLEFDREGMREPVIAGLEIKSKT